MSPSPASRSSTATPFLLAAATAALGFAGYAWWRAETRFAEQAAAFAQNQEVLDEILGEVTRIRIEQSADTKGPQALLEKLTVYAPLVSNARVTEPDYQNAKKEIAAILRAFASIGRDAWDPIMSRIAELDPRDDHDEVKQLLEAAIRVDPKQGTKLVEDVLLGLKLPAPRLRWYAAHILTERDKPLARQLLRRVLETESYRGVNPERAAAQNLPIPDLAAVAQTGFNNFVVAYVRTDDPKMDETLLQVLGRAEHDVITIQECVEALGNRRCERAVEPIKKLYLNPPLQQENPIFLAKCLEAIVEIQRAEAKPFLEDALPRAASDVMAKRIQFLLQKIERNEFEPRPPLKAGNGK